MSALSEKTLALHDKIVETALADITRRLPRDAPLGHLSDHDKVVAMFLLFRRWRVTVDLEASRKWLTKHGWSERDADRVVVIGETILSVERCAKKWESSTGGALPRDMVQRWRRNARARPGTLEIGQET